MSVRYATAYRARIVPWEKAGRAGLPVLERLLAREEQSRPDRRGRALDLGCGRGAHTKLLVDRGWDAIGVDNVRQAVDVAVHRNELDDARFVIGDVRHLVHCGVGTAFDLFLDVGCFQGLDDADRMLMATGITALAEPGAAILLHTAAHQPWYRGGHGASAADLERAFTGWTVTQERDAEVDEADADRQGTWYRLTRS
ncbi:class I SAM-dependent methyltransferase [Nocardioides hwasunensis]|uniref:Class I SAM-dependent methyltransferase n=1 Tax=Nocardioides hwasunensis TaxID=397258 RepID=A0ABR8MJ54_9ACTN|nr:class I SAM-dependent methyltransferase [Nocardioides hwasunensis]MBD3914519.1 class I SAM-dependent methyltransferase [Nocardioides hwasunensis]